VGIGDIDGCGVGAGVGLEVGKPDGWEVGILVKVGIPVGWDEGIPVVGWDEGIRVGLGVGLSVGGGSPIS
jgi:hypothetical protein